MALYGSSRRSSQSSAQPSTRLAVWAFTSRSDGDFGTLADEPRLKERCNSIAEHPWTLLDQVHGADVIRVEAPGAHYGASGDAAVTTCSNAVVAVRTADCAGVVMIGLDSEAAPIAVGAAHAGWRGLQAGVLQNTVSLLRDLGAVSVQWALGPSISPDHYQFGKADMVGLIERYGEDVRSVTIDGDDALDMRAGVLAAMSEAGAQNIGQLPPCTAADPEYFSWRARAETGRQVAAVWLTDDVSPPESQTTLFDAVVRQDEQHAN